MSTEHLNFREVLDFGIGSLSPPSRSSLPLLLRFSQVHCSCSYITWREGGRRARASPSVDICIFGKVAIRRGKRKRASLLRSFALRVVRDRFGADHARSNPAVPSCLSFSAFSQPADALLIKRLEIFHASIFESGGFRNLLSF